MARRDLSAVGTFYGQWFTEARKLYGVIIGSAAFAALELGRRAVRHYYPDSTAMMEAVPSWFLPSLSGLTILCATVWAPYKIHSGVTAELERIKGTPPNLALAGDPTIAPYPPVSPGGQRDRMAEIFARYDASVRIVNLPIEGSWGRDATNVHATFVARDGNAREYGPFVGLWEDRERKLMPRLDVLALGETRRVMLVKKDESSDAWYPYRAVNDPGVTASECEITVTLSASSHVLPPIRLVLTNLGKGYGLQLERA
jgi:hypothetical protein